MLKGLLGGGNAAQHNQNHQNVTSHPVTGGGNAINDPNCNVQSNDGQLHSVDKQVQGDLTAKLGVEIETRGELKVENTELQDVVIDSQIGQFECVTGANLTGGACAAPFSATQSFEAPVSMTLQAKLKVDMSAVAEMIARAAVQDANYTVNDNCPIPGGNPPTRPNPEPPPEL